MVKCNSEIIENSDSDQQIKYQNRVCGIQTSTSGANAHDLCKCCVKEGLKGSKSTVNVKSRYKTPKLLDKLHRKQHSFQVRLRMTIKINKQTLYVVFGAQMVIVEFAIN